ncbi:hypothetical protein SBBP1_420042 [Burkholderiales bacterium]|nr:hypothetical protein SBBP1_420042 [Burkholderiales bacterium]
MTTANTGLSSNICSAGSSRVIEAPSARSTNSTALAARTAWRVSTDGARGVSMKVQLSAGRASVSSRVPSQSGSTISRRSQSTSAGASIAPNGRIRVPSLAANAAVFQTWPWAARLAMPSAGACSAPKCRASRFCGSHSTAKPQTPLRAVSVARDAVSVLRPHPPHGDTMAMQGISVLAQVKRPHAAQRLAGEQALLLAGGSAPQQCADRCHRRGQQRPDQQGLQEELEHD